MSVPGDCSSETLLVFLDNGKARSPILIKDRDLYPQNLANTPTLSNAKSRISSSSRVLAVWRASRSISSASPTVRARSIPTSMISAGTSAPPMAPASSRARAAVFVRCRKPSHRRACRPRYSATSERASPPFSVGGDLSRLQPSRSSMTGAAMFQPLVEILLFGHSRRCRVTLRSFGRRSRLRVV